MKHKSQFPTLEGRAVLSPMSGVTDVAFRALCRKYGAALTYTEFVSGTAIIRGNVQSLRMIKTDPIEKPVAVQLFGANVDDVVEAARRMEETFDIIDVNCGCPAWKVIKTGAGSELLKKPQGIASFINKLSSAVNKPVTVKIRIGIDDQSINAVEVAKLAEDAGAAAIAIHGRTQKQGYSGQANWDIIKQVKDAVNVPVIGNGDVFSPETFKMRLDQSGVDYIMIARGAIGNPFIFTQINDFLKDGKYVQGNRVKQFFEFFELAKKYKIPYPSIQTHAMNFTKTMKGGAQLREALSRCKTEEDLIMAFGKTNMGE
ncbi:tRNA dihydrouridine synthase DusB [Candidatus Woesearchaeota archaeon]|nr:tRNA dihydrouridine synthase DusB [Candidatus Woesearchaeota archaeon]